MEQRLVISCVVIVLCFTAGSVEAYKNYTVGDSLGWFDNLEKPAVDYEKWVSDKHFSLGDFLIFNTDNNHSVIQTYNATTYKLCDYEDAQDKDTIQWSVSDPSASEPHPISVAVPLVKEGMTYFFSSDYDGEQCQNGQRFKINVTYGQGLPKSLRNSPDEAPSPVGAVAGADDSAPDTIVPSNFSHPQDTDDDTDNDNEKSSSISMSMYLKLHKKFYGSLVFLGLVFLF